MMTETNTYKLVQIQSNKEQESTAATPSSAQGPLTAEQQLDLALGVGSAPQKDLKAEVLSQIFKVMDDKEKMHNEVMYGMGNSQPQSLIQQSAPVKPMTPLEKNSNEFISKISAFSFGINYNI